MEANQQPDQNPDPLAVQQLDQLDQNHDKGTKVKVDRSLVIVALVSAGGFFAPGVFLFTRIPLDNLLFAVPQILLLFALVMPILYWQSVVPRLLAKRVATWASALMWITGIVLMFALQHCSHFIVLSDGLLLLGFVPLLYLWRFSLPWILFGILNSAIGFFLLMLSLIPDSYFPSHLWPAKHHLVEYHPPIAWIMFGIATTVFGLLRLVKNLFRMASEVRVRRSAGLDDVHTDSLPA